MSRSNTTLTKMTPYARHVEQYQRFWHANQHQINRVVAIRRYLDHHFAQDIDLATLGKAHAISKYHLWRLFRKHYGQTVQHYLTERRISMARVHLRRGASVRDTCFAVGFSSPGSFTHLFKRRVGMTPGQYRKRNFRYVS
ncbi:MAG: AraC family transcriptional regulator [Saprospiraceae bacterium]|nr:AraC family transcriptional regulator [Saprospiraceae bacterium]